MGQNRQKRALRPSLFGETVRIDPESRYVPLDIAAGTVPRVPGHEESAVYNAAAVVVGRERVVVRHSGHGDLTWYIAAAGADLANNADSWCPFAAVLPGMPDAVPAPAIYTCTQGEVTFALLVLGDSMRLVQDNKAPMQLWVERAARDHGAQVVPLDDRAADLRPTPWRSISLAEERAARTVVVGVSMVGVAAAALGAAIWVSALSGMAALRVDVEEARADADATTAELLSQATALGVGATQERIAEFHRVNAAVLRLNGQDLSFDGAPKGGGVRWSARVPSGVTGNVIQDLGARTVRSDPLWTYIEGGRR